MSEKAVGVADDAPLLDAALVTLRERVAAARFAFDTPEAADARAAQEEILGQLDNYVLPRLRRRDAPLLVVFAGSTGAGKSTLVNSLARASVTVTGVRRPTTRAPVVACHPDDAGYFEGAGVLPSFPRRRRRKDDRRALTVVAADGVPRGIGLLDTPDIDSVVAEHHDLARELVTTADLWLFVTTAARYADAIPWDMLHQARDRGVTLGVTLNRVPPDAAAEIRGHLRTMLDEGGLDEAQLFVVPEARVSGSMLSGRAVEPVRAWFNEIVTDEERRSEVVRGTMRGVLNSFRTTVPALAKQVENQSVVASDLRREVDAAYEAAKTEIDETLRDGSLLRGEVLARWQDFVTTSDLQRALQRRRALRRRAHATHHGAVEQQRALEAAVTRTLASLIESGAEHAANDAVARWRERQAGSALLANAPATLAHASPYVARRAAQSLSAWRHHVVTLVQSEGTTRRSISRILSLDLETLALLLMVGALGEPAGDAASRASTLPQRLLRGIFGAESLRTVVAKARADLHARVISLFDEEAARFAQLIEAAGVPDESAVVQLYQAAYTLEVAR